MTEEDWLKEPKRLHWIHHLVGLGLASDRKLWLLSAGQCRCIWHLLDEWDRATVEHAERCADGRGGRRDLEARFRLAYGHPRDKAIGAYVCYCIQQVAHTERLVQQGGYEAWQGGVTEEEVGVKGRPALVGTVNSFVASAEREAFLAAGVAQTDAEQSGEAMQQRVYGVFRDIFGNPCRPVAADRSWLTGKVRGLARTIYKERAFERMPELADDLGRAGCTSVELIDHCRGPGEHYRGCWALDILLGKK